MQEEANLAVKYIIRILGNIKYCTQLDMTNVINCSYKILCYYRRSQHHMSWNSGCAQTYSVNIIENRTSSGGMYVPKLGHCVIQHFGFLVIRVVVDILFLFYSALFAESYQLTMLSV